MRRIWIVVLLATIGLLLAACGPGGRYATGSAATSAAPVAVSQTPTA